MITGPHPVEPPHRRPLRVFAFDPMRAGGGLGAVTIDVENEPLTWGPTGDRVRVVDYDATRGVYYEPVNLDDPAILMQAGLAPSEPDPRFHQQMVYAVTLKVLENFDRALGRRVTFRGRKLVLIPHAFRSANAFFDPKLNAVCFGYFTADENNPGENLPGQTVFTCLSQDIIAHEVTHAVVHRLRPYFAEPTNRDVLAFHEGFCDIVAIFQHFTFPDVLTDAVGATRGDIASPSSLVSLASQFGHATGRGGALRSALDGVPDPSRYETATEPHARGSILVAAVFDAFFRLYQRRIRDLIRIATDGRGVLPVGDLHPDLVARLAGEASAAAQDILTMCIRAFEYLPPVDITFGDYLRAVITADHDLVGEAGVEQRRAIVEAFRRRGIYPQGVISLSEEALRLPERVDVGSMPAGPLAQRLAMGAQSLRPRQRTRNGESVGPSEDPKVGRETYGRLRSWVHEHADGLGLDAEQRIEVRGFHATYRVRPDNELVVEVVAQFLQKHDTTGDARFGGLPFRGGTTVVASADGRVRFVVAKPMSAAREQAQIEHVRQMDLTDDTLPWADASRLARRARRDFRRLHRGLYA